MLFRSWLETVDAVITCRNREMIISNGPHNQTLSMFPPDQKISEVPLWLESPYGDEYSMFPLLTLEQSRGL